LASTLPANYVLGVARPLIQRSELVLKITGKPHWLGPAVDQHGYVLEIVVQSRHNKQAAKQFFGKLLKACHKVARVLITEKLASYRAAKQHLLRRLEQRQHKRARNRAETSEQPPGQRERRLRRLRSAGQAQRFLAAHALIREHICRGRDRLSAHQ